MKVKKKKGDERRLDLVYKNKKKPLYIDEYGTKVFALHPKTNEPICGAISQLGNDEICIRKPVGPNGRCWKHKGKAYPKNTALAKMPEMKGMTAKYSHLPPGMVGSFITTMQLPDEEVVSVKSEIAFIDAVISEEIEGFKDFNFASMKVIEELSADIIELADDVTHKGTEKLRDRAYAIAIAVEQFKSKKASVDRIKTHQEHRRKLSETESKLISSKMRQLTAEQAIQFATGLVAIVNNHVKDITILEMIADDVEKLMQVPKGSLPGIRKFMEERRNAGFMKERPNIVDETNDDDVIDVPFGVNPSNYTKPIEEDEDDMDEE